MIQTNIKPELLASHEWKSVPDRLSYSLSDFNCQTSKELSCTKCLSFIWQHRSHSTEGPEYVTQFVLVGGHPPSSGAFRNIIVTAAAHISCDIHVLESVMATCWRESKAQEQRRRHHQSLLVQLLTHDEVAQIRHRQKHTHTHNIYTQYIYKKNK